MIFLFENKVEIDNFNYFTFLKKQIFSEFFDKNNF